MRVGSQTQPGNYPVRCWVMLSYFTAHIAHLRRQRDSSGYSFDVKVEEILSSRTARWQHLSSLALASNSVASMSFSDVFKGFKYVGKSWQWLQFILSELICYSLLLQLVNNIGVCYSCTHELTTAPGDCLHTCALDTLTYLLIYLFFALLILLFFSH